MDLAVGGRDGVN